MALSGLYETYLTPLDVYECTRASEPNRPCPTCMQAIARLDRKALQDVVKYTARFNKTFGIFLNEENDQIGQRNATCVLEATAALRGVLPMCCCTDGIFSALNLLGKVQIPQTNFLLDNANEPALNLMAIFLITGIDHKFLHPATLQFYIPMLIRRFCEEYKGIEGRNIVETNMLITLIIQLCKAICNTNTTPSRPLNALNIINTIYAYLLSVHSDALKTNRRCQIYDCVQSSARIIRESHTLCETAQALINSIFYIHPYLETPNREFNLNICNTSWWTEQEGVYGTAIIPNEAISRLVSSSVPKVDLKQIVQRGVCNLPDNLREIYRTFENQSPVPTHRVHWSDNDAHGPSDQRGSQHQRQNRNHHHGHHDRHQIPPRATKDRNRHPGLPHSHQRPTSNPENGDNNEDDTNTGNDNRASQDPPHASGEEDDDESSIEPQFNITHPSELLDEHVCNRIKMYVETTQFRNEIEEDPNKEWVNALVQKVWDRFFDELQISGEYRNIMNNAVKVAFRTNETIDTADAKTFWDAYMPLSIIANKIKADNENEDDIWRNEEVIIFQISMALLILDETFATGLLSPRYETAYEWMQDANNTLQSMLRHVYEKGAPLTGTDAKLLRVFYMLLIAAWTKRTSHKIDEQETKARMITEALRPNHKEASKDSIVEDDIRFAYKVIREIQHHTLEYVAFADRIGFLYSRVVNAETDSLSKHIQRAIEAIQTRDFYKDLITDCDESAGGKTIIGSVNDYREKAISVGRWLLKIGDSDNMASKIEIAKHASSFPAYTVELKNAPTFFDVIKLGTLASEILKIETPKEDDHKVLNNQFETRAGHMKYVQVKQNVTRSIAKIAAAQQQFERKSPEFQYMEQRLRAYHRLEEHVHKNSLYTAYKHELDSIKECTDKLLEKLNAALHLEPLRLLPMSSVFDACSWLSALQGLLRSEATDKKRVQDIRRSLAQLLAAMRTSLAINHMEFIKADIYSECDKLRIADINNSIFHAKRAHTLLKTLQHMKNRFYVYDGCQLSAEKDHEMKQYIHDMCAGVETALHRARTTSEPKLKSIGAEIERREEQEVVRRLDNKTDEEETQIGDIHTVTLKLREYKDTPAEHTQKFIETLTKEVKVNNSKEDLEKNIRDKLEEIWKTVELNTMIPALYSILSEDTDETSPDDSTKINIISMPWRKNTELSWQIPAFPPHEGKQNREYITELYTLGKDTADDSDGGVTITEIALSEYATGSRATLRFPTKITSESQAEVWSEVY